MTKHLVGKVNKEDKLKKKYDENNNTKRISVLEEISN